MTTTGPDPFSFSQDGSSSQGNAKDSLRSMSEAAAQMLDGYARFMTRLAGGAAQSQGAGAAPGGLPEALAEVWGITSGSALRYGQGMSDVFARHQGALTNSLALQFTPGTTDEEQQRLADVEALRAFLREIGATAVFEARRLEQELEAIGENMAQRAAGQWPEDADHRTWSVKR